MNQSEKQLPKESWHPPTDQVRERLRRLERQDWWLWWATVLISLLLTLTVVSLTLYVLSRTDEPIFQFNLNQAVRGLVGLVLLFNIYAVYQHIVIKRFRRQLLEREIQMDEFQNLALFDPLTGLYNRRIAQHRLPEEIARFRRTNSPLAVLLFDLDDFKRINDRYGHSVGDQVLKEFARLLKNAIRFSDVAMRMGGDEFLVILPGCDAEQVQLLLGRMRPFEVD
ncbi:MAG: GGDEF domain-containing protein, partial [Acidobacteria bacterium]|nr:GGDEF domain-containing protein [Acidobacteriota bacterium]